MMRRRWIRLSAAVAAAGLLGGCVSVLPNAEAPIGRFRLTPPELDRADLPRSERMLVVEQPLADRTLDTALIAVARSPNKYQYYANAEWADAAPEMVQTLIIRAFEDSGKIRSVQRRERRRSGDVVLSTELRRFESDVSGRGAIARIEIMAKLLDAHSGELIDSALFSAQSEARNDKIENVIDAFDVASGDILLDLVSWTLKSAP